ncbi:hypothetical protein SCH4B_3389 [Ruegeria sp. TrichCH4B]|nr:hypothetical protein SCH4B_3389 [Ruegeria sp. TrichCH4B]
MDGELNRLAPPEQGESAHLDPIIARRIAPCGVVYREMLMSGSQIESSVQPVDRILARHCLREYL